MESLIDTHCHIHDSEYDFDIDEVLQNNSKQNIIAMICVGTCLRSSMEAIHLSQQQDNCYASFGLHPHLAVRPLQELKASFAALREAAFKDRQRGKLVAIGECGLDYFYHRRLDIRQRQLEMFEWHFVLARDLDLPLIFHVRQAFEDFWSLYDKFKLPAVLHSFSDVQIQVEKGLKYQDLYFGLNGIMTFTRDQHQLEAARSIPATRLLLETDAPYLTPVPFRGKTNQPGYLRTILDFLARLRDEEADSLTRQTTLNARSLFGI